MATLEQLETALRNADAAGDTMAARMLAAEVVKMRSVAPPQAAPESPGMLTGLGNEIAGAFNENLDTFKAAGPQNVDPQNYSSLQSLLNVGKAAAAIPGMALSPLTGAARYTIGNAFDAVSPLTAEQQQQFGLESGRDVADLSMMGLAPRGMSPVGARTVAPPVPSAAELKQAAVDVYKSPQIKAIKIAPSDVARLAEKTESSLLNDGFRPTPNSAPDTLSELSNLYPGNIPSVSVDDLRAARRALQKTTKQVGQDFKPTPDAEAARRAINELDDFLDNLSPDLRTANKNYAAGKSSEALQFRQMMADRRAAKTGSGMNIENTMRQEVDKIPDRGLSADQRALKEKIVLGDRTRDALRTTGKLGVDGGLSLMLHAGAAFGTSGSSLPITVTGTLARKLGEMLTRRQIGQLNKSIRGSSPLAKSLAPVALPAPNPLLGIPASGMSLAELLGGFRPYPALVPSRAERERQ